MNPPNSENHPDHPGIPAEIRAPRTAKEKAQQLWESEQNLVRENPAVAALGLLIAGVLIGLLVGHRCPFRKNQARHAPREFVDELCSRISEHWPQVKRQGCASSSILEHCQNVGKKFKWW